MRTATYITPADAPSKALWDAFVEKEGGNAETRVTLEYLGEVEGERGEQPPPAPPDTFVLAGAAGVRDMVDSKQRSAPGEQWSVVNTLTGIFPELTKTRTEPELANILTENGIAIGGEAPPAPQPDHAAAPAPTPVVEDLNAEQKAARAGVVKWAQRAARKRQGGGALDEKIGETMKQIYISHKQKCGMGVGTPIDQLDAAQLRRLAESIQMEVLGE